MAYKYTIQELQYTLQLNDQYLCDKLNISIGKLNAMKDKNEKDDFKHIKSILIHERAKAIKFLK